MSGSDRRRLVAGLGLAVALGLAVRADTTSALSAPAFDAIARLFYEKSALAELRRPTQLPLFRAHLMIVGAIGAAGLVASPWMGPHARRWWAIFGLGYAVRAGFWIAGGGLPLIPGDSCHYLEVATSVYRGEGPVKHYVESYFRDYPAIRQGRGVLDDWATPLWAYVLAGAYRLVGVVPGRSLEATVAVAKGASFALNLLGLPALYGFARRRFGPRVALGAMGGLAVLPAHAIYAGFALRESLVALTAVLAVWALSEVWHARGGAAWGWAVAAGGLGGLAILARNTALALVAGAGAFAFAVGGRRRFGPLLLWGATVALVITPWAWATYREYGEPFYTYTKFFQYNFSWTVHHYMKGATRAAEFYTAANLPAIVRVKVKSLLIVVLYSAMIVGLPLALAFARRLLRPGPEPQGRDADRLALTLLVVFALATLANIADVTQVQQLGRYYLPVYLLALPTAVAGLLGWLSDRATPAARLAVFAVAVAVPWADPTWAYDASWYAKGYQLHWPALRAAGDWMKAHPGVVPGDARVMAWFPWELRVASDRTTVLLPRSYHGPHIERALRDYGVTHVLWGSFEPPPDVDPETWGPYLTRLRLSLGLADDREVYRSPKELPYPVRLYRLDGGRP